MSAIETLADRLVATLPFSGHIARFRNRLATFGDQAAQGVANVGVAMLAARQMSREDFASIGVMLGVHFLMFGFHRAIVTLPYILDQHSTEEETGCWWRINLLVVAGIFVILALVGGGLFLAAGANPKLAWVARGVLTAAVVSPLLCTADFARRRLFQALHATTAAVASTLYALLSFGWIILTPMILGRQDAWLASGAWAIGAVGSAAISFALRPGRFGSWSEAFGHWKPFKDFSLWQAATHLPYTLYNNSAVLVIGALAGPIAASAFTTARTMANPAASIVAAVDSLDKPRAARALRNNGIPGLKGSIGKTRNLIILLTGLYLGALILAAPIILKTVFGTKYAGEAFALQVLAASFFLVGLNQPFETMLIVLRSSRSLFVTRTLAAITAIAALWTGAHFGGLVGACWALFATQVVNLILLRIAEHFAVKAHRIGPNAEAAAQAETSPGETAGL